MENSFRPSYKKRIIKWMVGIVLLILGMILCGIFGYYISKSLTPPDISDGVQSKNNIPKTISSAPPSVPEEATHTEVPPEDKSVFAPPSASVDSNDYLVIAENGSVNLYLLTDNGEQVFSRLLDIPLSALLPEDCLALENGVIVDTKEDLAYLLEDFSS